MHRRKIWRHGELCRVHLHSVPGDGPGVHRTGLDSLRQPSRRLLLPRDSRVRQHPSELHQRVRLLGQTSGPAHTSVRGSLRMGLQAQHLGHNEVLLHLRMGRKDPEGSSVDGVGMASTLEDDSSPLLALLVAFEEGWLLPPAYRYRQSAYQCLCCCMAVTREGPCWSAQLQSEVSNLQVLFGMSIHVIESCSFHDSFWKFHIHDIII